MLKLIITKFCIIMNNLLAEALFVLKVAIFDFSFKFVTNLISLLLSNLNAKPYLVYNITKLLCIDNNNSNTDVNSINKL